ncbi:MAG: 3-dehydroquinate synthase [Candidatus Omnitrophota bacterium]
MTGKTITVCTPENTYPIYIGARCVFRIGSFVAARKLGNVAVIVTSARVYTLHKKTIEAAFLRLPHRIVIVDDGEKAKSFPEFLKIISSLLEVDGVGKALFLVCIGGGTVGDVGGFAASVYKRGIPYIQVPTTLLAQIDSSIGGKTAIDLPQAKNILGTFYQPKAVFIDPAFLLTLGPRQVREGMAEAIKYGVIEDRAFFDYLRRYSADILALRYQALNHVIQSCVAIKARIVSRDEREKKGIRTILNFGHTLAHALEASGAYAQLTHGEAVALGMCYAAKLSFSLGTCSAAAVRELHHAIKLFGLPTVWAKPSRGVLKAMRYDKKFTSGGMRMVLLRRIGKVKVINAIAPAVVSRTLRSFCVSGLGSGA